MSPSLSNFISVDDLHARLQEAIAPVILDLRYQPANPGGRERYLEGHIPGAIFVDLPSELADAEREDGGNNPLPRPEKLQDDIRRWGISADSTVFVYDDDKGTAAARAWWVLKWAGVERVQILAGGLKAWLAAGLTVAAGEPHLPAAGDFSVTANGRRFLNADQVSALATDFALIDARPGEAFARGHIPGARSLPAARALHASGAPDEASLARALAEIGVSQGQPIVAYCGSGVAASSLVAALEDLGRDVTLYPGSWSEWHEDKKLPAEV